MQGVIKEDKKFKLERPITGIIHQDRIWEQWYDPEIFKMQLPKMNQTDYFFRCNKDYLDQIIINNRGMKKMSVSDIGRLILLYYKALKTKGVGKGDRVATIALTTPELIALKYACGMVGAITSNLNFKDAENGNLVKQLHKINPNMIFVLDLLEGFVSEILNLEEFKDIEKYILPLEKSTPISNSERIKIEILKMINTVKGKRINGAQSFRKFVGYAANYEGIIESVYEEKMACNIAFTSGTTGLNKAVLLSHDANNILAWQHKMGGLNLKRGEKNLALVPPLLAIWDADIIHAGMCIGFEEILELELSYENIPSLLKKYNPNYGIWSQYLWDSFLTMSEEDRRNIAPYLKKVVVGGERGDINQALRFYEMTGLYQEAGYGCTEVNSCFTVAHPNCNVLGSAGIPLPFNNVRIRKDGKDLTYNERGQIYLTGPTLMNGYYNDSQLTKEVFKHFDGEKESWYDTGDYGFVDCTGSLNVLDRYSDPIIINSEQIQKADITELINGYFGVKMCKTDYYDNKLVCHIVLDNYAPETIDELKNGLIGYIRDNISLDLQPDIINFIDSFPRTPLGKVSYGEVANMTKEIVDSFPIVENSKLNIYSANLILARKN